MFMVENDLIGLAQYTHADDIDMFACWQDIETQKGYNGIFNQTFDEFRAYTIELFKFWVTVIDKKNNQKVGVLRLGLDEVCPDLAIWIYPRYILTITKVYKVTRLTSGKHLESTVDFNAREYRNRGYGTQAFSLALKYIFHHYPYHEISAGCYEDNVNSLKMLKKIGFIHYPNGDCIEKNCFTGEKTIQLEFRITCELMRDVSI